MENIFCLFDKFKLEGDVEKTILVGQNMLNKNSGSREVFDKYFEYLIELVDSNEKYRGYLQKAEMALSFYAENAELTEQTIEYILGRYNLIRNIRDNMIRKSCLDNEETLKLIERLINRMGNTSEKDSFNNDLTRVEKMDMLLDKDNFTAEQQELYASISKKCATIVENRLRYFERKKNIEYNLQAVSSYEKVYQLFKGNNCPNNHEQIMKEFFSYDASRLFNETLVYYNQVYSYILSKLNDKDKFLLTKAAILGERNMIVNGG